MVKTHGDKAKFDTSNTPVDPNHMLETDVVWCNLWWDERGGHITESEHKVTDYPRNVKERTANFWPKRYLRR